MQEITKELMKVASHGVIVGNPFRCSYCRRMSDELGAKNATYSNGETSKVCAECASKLIEVGVKIQ